MFSISVEEKAKNSKKKSKKDSYKDRKGIHSTSTVDTMYPKVDFSCGNPNVEEIYGEIKLFKKREINPNSNEDVPINRSCLLCVLAVPSFFSVNNFCNFIEEHMKYIKKIRILRDGSPNKYMVLVKIDEQKNADSFFRFYNGKEFTNIDPEVVFVKSVCVHKKEKSKRKSEKIIVMDEVDPKSPLAEHARFPTENNLFESRVNVELPTCPVCLERLDDNTSGIITTMCNHEFHSACLKKWGDSSCPVCRYSGDELETVCGVCSTQENLWICLTCGAVGCGRYMKGHARDHFKDTGHCYSMELESQRVWDYVGDNYVHRLIENQLDGKIVSVEGINKEFMEEQIKQKQSQLEMEYNILLVNNLSKQRLFFEEKIQKMELKCKKEKKQLESKISVLRNEKAKEKAKLKKDISFINEINKSLMLNQDGYVKKNKIISEKYEEKINRLEKGLKERDRIISRQKEEVQDLYNHLSFGNKIKNDNNLRKAMDRKISAKVNTKTNTQRKKNNKKRKKTNKKK